MKYLIKKLKLLKLTCAVIHFLSECMCPYLPLSCISVGCKMLFIIQFHHFLNSHSFLIPIDREDHSMTMWWAHHLSTHHWLSFAGETPVEAHCPGEYCGRVPPRQWQLECLPVLSTGLQVSITALQPEHTMPVPLHTNINTQDMIQAHTYVVGDLTGCPLEMLMCIYPLCCVYTDVQHG